MTIHSKKLHFSNQSNDTLTSIVLNDWNNAYSTKNTPLAKRFSDEFYRGFHLAKEEERGSTTNISILDANKMDLSWERTEKNPDLIEIKLNRKTTSQSENHLISSTYYD
ncbi:hypothetical protein [Flavobacterium sp. GNP001]